MPQRPPQRKEAEAFARRLRLALKQAGFKNSATDLAHAFNLRDWGTGITPHATRNWINGISIPKQNRLRILCDILQVTPHALLFGPEPAGEAKIPQDREDHNAHLADRCMWRVYHTLSVEHRRMVREMTNGLYRLEKSKTAHKKDSDEWDDDDAEMPPL